MCLINAAWSKTVYLGLFQSYLYRTYFQGWAWVGGNRVFSLLLAREHLEGNSCHPSNFNLDHSVPLGNRVPICIMC